MNSKIWLIASLILFIPCISTARLQTTADTTGWNYVPVILQSIIPPAFPNREFRVTDFGADSLGVNDCSLAFTRAIDSCSYLGGGTVIVPAGQYLTGPLYLRSNVHLFVAKNATIKFSTDTAKYMPVVYTRFESIECMNFSPLIYAFEQTNIAITGEGVLDGQAADNNWWAWKNLSSPDTTVLNAMVANGVPVEQRIFGSGHHLRPNFFQPYRCTNILVEGVTFKDSPMWAINPVLCQNVTVLNVTVTANSGGSRPNTDGCDPECCTNVLIKGCTFSTGDDCIAIKSGRNADGRRVNVPCTNVVIQNCAMQDGHGGITLGSETSGGISNIFAENTIMNSPNLQYALRFKTNSMRGGTIENIYERNITVLQVSRYILHIECKYGNETGTFIPIVRNLSFDSIVCTMAPNALYMRGLPGSQISAVTLSNCTFTNITNLTNTIIDVSGLQYNNVTLNGNLLSDVRGTMDKNIPGHFELRQNYPNPFNPVTTITYDVPRRAFVTITVYTMLGQKVQILTQEEKQSGTYSVLFNGSYLSSGMYFYVLQADEYIITRKLILIK